MNLPIGKLNDQAPEELKPFHAMLRNSVSILVAARLHEFQFQQFWQFTGFSSSFNNSCKLKKPKKILTKIRNKVKRKKYVQNLRHILKYTVLLKT